MEVTWTQRLVVNIVAEPLRRFVCLGPTGGAVGRLYEYVPRAERYVVDHWTLRLVKNDAWRKPNQWHAYVGTLHFVYVGYQWPSASRFHVPLGSRDVFD